MKKIVLFLFPAFFCLAELASPLLPAAEKFNYRKWLNEEVYWLITAAEKQAFNKLKTDKDREAFIALFWAKRDPTPDTEFNEFKDAYYANLAYVNQKYSRGQEMGWKTDVGKILLIFGLPRERRANPETWTYSAIPHLKINSDFDVVFDPVETVGFVLNENLTSRAALEAMDEYAQRTILHPDMKAVPDHRRSVMRDPNAFEKEILEKASTAEPEAGEIPFDTALFFSKAEGGKTSVTVVYYFNPKEIGSDRVVLFGKTTSRDGKAQNFRREIRLNKDDYFGQVVLALRPDRYEVILALKEVSSERHSADKIDLDVPDYWTGKMDLGSLILSDRIEATTPGEEEYSAFNFGQYLAYPKKDYIFKKSDTLNAAFQIYNVAVSDGRARLVLEISLKSSTRTYRLPEQPLEREVPEDQAVVFGLPIPLTQIEPGDYELLVKVTDRVGRQSMERTEKVVIVD